MCGSRMMRAALLLVLLMVSFPVLAPFALWGGSPGGAGESGEISATLGIDMGMTSSADLLLGLLLNLEYLHPVSDSMRLGPGVSLSTHLGLLEENSREVAVYGTFEYVWTLIDYGRTRYDAFLKANLGYVGTSRGYEDYDYYSEETISVSGSGLYLGLGGGTVRNGWILQGMYKAYVVPAATYHLFVFEFGRRFSL